MSKRSSILNQHERIGRRIERLRFRLLVEAIEAEAVKKSSREARALRRAERELGRIKSDLDEVILQSVSEAEVDAAKRCYYPGPQTEDDRLIERALLADGENMTL